MVFGTLYPAYASYKAVKMKNVKEYVKWMMYWIVFGFFTCIDTLFDIFLSWMPLYYEMKVIFVLWLLCPLTNGSTFLFKQFVHPHLARHEKEIDDMIAMARSRGYSTLVNLGSRGFSFASNMVMSTALMGQSKLVDHLRRSYSTSDLANDGVHLVPRHMAVNDEQDENDDDQIDSRLLEDRQELARRSKQLTGSVSESTALLNNLFCRLLANFSFSRCHRNYFILIRLDLLPPFSVGIAVSVRHAAVSLFTVDDLDIGLLMTPFYL